MATFSSLEAALAYIKSGVASAMTTVADNMMQIAQQETASQLRGYDGSTGATIKCIQPTSVSANGAEITWTNGGGWYSVYTGQHVYAPLMHELGYTWGVGASNFVDASFSQIESEIPRILKGRLIAMGIPVS